MTRHALWYAQTSLGSVALLALTMCSTAPAPPAPPPLPPPPAAIQTAPAGLSATTVCLAFARTAYPGIKWDHWSMGSAPFQNEGVKGTRTAIDGARGEQSFRIACFQAPGHDDQHWVYALHPLTGEPVAEVTR